MRTLATAVALVGATACGTISNRPPPELPRPGEPTRLVDGEWSWRAESEQDGVRRVESERWHLVSYGDELRGYYDRRLELHSLDGTPFRCNQDTTYVLRARYQVSGAQDGARLVLREDRHETVPSPCEPGARRYAHYEAAFDGDSLQLRWRGGSQRLERVGEPSPPRPLATPAPVVNGAWRWATRNGERSEREAWLLEERAAGTIAGSYRRTVRDGDCELVEHYRIHGHREGERLTIAEIEVDVEPSACESHHGERHLDSARGTSYGDAIVLEWRGRRRQVLARQR